MSDLIDPIIHIGGSCCPKCGNPMFVVDSEMTLLMLDKYGMPLSHDTRIRCEGVCQVCGTVTPMRRMGMGYERDCPMLNELLDIRERMRREKSLAAKRLPADNPFGIPPELVYKENPG